MPAATKNVASERVVVLLRPKDKQKLARLAQRENASAAEILRRALELYSEASLISEKGLLAQIGDALDHMHATLKAANERIEERSLQMEQLRQDPDHQKRIAQLDDFIAQHAGGPQTQKAKKRAA